MPGCSAQDTNDDSVTETPMTAAKEQEIVIATSEETQPEEEPRNAFQEILSEKKLEGKTREEVLAELGEPVMSILGADYVDTWEIDGLTVKITFD